MRKILAIAVVLLCVTGVYAQVEDTASGVGDSATQTFEFGVNVLPYMETKDFAPFVGPPVITPGSPYVQFNVLGAQIVAYSNHAVEAIVNLMPLSREEKNVGGVGVSRWDQLVTQYFIEFHFNLAAPVDNISWGASDPGHPLFAHPHHVGGGYLEPPRTFPFLIPPIGWNYNFQKQSTLVPHNGNIRMTLRLRYGSDPASFNPQFWFQSQDSGTYTSTMLVTYTLENFIP